jgi:hypothetical protein
MGMCRLMGPRGPRSEPPPGGNLDEAKFRAAVSSRGQHASSVSAIRAVRALSSNCDTPLGARFGAKEDSVIDRCQHD